VTNEWDNTPWQGSAPPRTRTLSTAVVTQKAVTSLGPWATGIPLSSVNHSPQDRMAAYLRAYKVGWFYKAGRKIADDFANLPWRVKDGDSESTDPEETTLQNPDLDIPFDQLSPIQQFQRLMERPNPSQTGRQLRKKTRIRLDFAGCAFWYLEGVDAPSGLPTAIYGISPPRMWPAYDRQGQLIGWVMDKDQPSGGVPFDANEILLFCEDGADDDPFGVSVVQSVQGHVGLSDAMATHVGDVMATGGRLAGMLWPKSRALDEAEFTQAQRAWRNATSDTNAARRLLLFPEPMEYSAGAASPKDIGLPELAAVDRDAILTAFPASRRMTRRSRSSSSNDTSGSWARPSPTRPRSPTWTTPRPFWSVWQLSALWLRRASTRRRPSGPPGSITSSSAASLHLHRWQRDRSPRRTRARWSATTRRGTTRPPSRPSSARRSRPARTSPPGPRLPSRGSSRSSGSG
jgi:hypothetical protein